MHPRRHCGRVRVPRMTGLLRPPMGMPIMSRADSRRNLLFWLQKAFRPNPCWEAVNRGAQDGSAGRSALERRQDNRGSLLSRAGEPSRLPVLFRLPALCARVRCGQRTALRRGAARGARRGSPDGHRASRQVRPAADRSDAFRNDPLRVVRRDLAAAVCKSGGRPATARTSSMSLLAVCPGASPQGRE